MHVKHGKFGTYRLWTHGDNWRLFNVVLIHVQSSVWLLLCPYFDLSLITLFLILHLFSCDIWLSSNFIPCHLAHALPPSLALNLDWIHIWSPPTKLWLSDSLCWSKSYEVGTHEHPQPLAHKVRRCVHVTHLVTHSVPVRWVNTSYTLLRDIFESLLVYQ